MPSESARSLWRTVSMSQRTMPSMSFGVSPASSMAASAAWVASVRSLRPELREKSVAPMPTIAHRSRWWNSAHQHSLPCRGRGAEHFGGVLAQLRGPPGRDAVERREPQRRPWIERRRDVGVLDFDEEAPRQEVLVVEQVVGRVDRADRQPAAPGRRGRPRPRTAAGRTSRRCSGCGRSSAGGTPGRGTPAAPGRPPCPCVPSHSTSVCHAFWSATKITKYT